MTPVSHARRGAAVLALALAAFAPAQAATVTCGDPDLGVRITVVDPGLEGGYCHAQTGNLQNSQIAELGLTLLAKEESRFGDVASALLDYTANGDRDAGTWTIDASRWGGWERLFLGFHFGGAGDTERTNPDSFIVELARGTSTGTWALSGTSAYRSNGLSNIYLLSRGMCMDCSVPPADVPEPATPALVAAGLLAAAARRRRA